NMQKYQSFKETDYMVDCVAVRQLKIHKKSAVCITRLIFQNEMPLRYIQLICTALTWVHKNGSIAPPTMFVFASPAICKPTKNWASRHAQMLVSRAHSLSDLTENQWI
uniref:Uncharacterized protein n=1 Tax=Oryzias latipes TaxID=8090 RepID=A0A3P9IPR0_ORYLA